MECIVTVELGTNAVRVMAFDLKGNVLGSTKGTYPTFHTDPDYSEQDPEQILSQLLYVLKNFLTENPSRGYTYFHLFLRVHAHLLWSQNGVPLGNAIPGPTTGAEKKHRH